MKQKKIRVMHLNSSIGYDGPSRGIFGQVKYMDSGRFQSVICEIKSTRHPKRIDDFIRIGCEHVSLDKNKIYDVSIIFKMVTLLKTQKIDVLNTHNALACWYGNIASRIAKVPVVFTLRNNQRQNYRLLLRKWPLYELARMLDSVTMNFADRVVAVSKRLEHFYCENEGIPRNKITTISNAIDLEQISRYDSPRDRLKAKEKIGCQVNTIVIGIVGDLVERKGHDCLVEAARKIISQNRNIVFLVVGDGPLRTDLDRKIESYAISEFFVFTGHVKNVFHYFAAMDIFVLPSYAEGLSRALMESMAMGIPSVCSDIDGNLDAVTDGQTGLLFPANNSELLSCSLHTLIRDGQLRVEMGEKARSKAKEKFDMRKLSKSYEDLYIDSILNESSNKI